MSEYWLSCRIVTVVRVSLAHPTRNDNWLIDQCLECPCTVSRRSSRGERAVVSLGIYTWTRDRIGNDRPRDLEARNAVAIGLVGVCRWYELPETDRIPGEEQGRCDCRHESIWQRSILASD